MFFHCFAILLSTLAISFARPELWTKGVRNYATARRIPPSLHGRGFPDSSGLVEERAAPPAAGCATENQLTVKAPKKNIFLGLTDEEAASVTAFLHDQKSLNLTAVVNGTRWDLEARSKPFI